VAPHPGRLDCALAAATEAQRTTIQTARFFNCAEYTVEHAKMLEKQAKVNHTTREKQPKPPHFYAPPSERRLAAGLKYSALRAHSLTTL
jgi:hypothetical protein